MRLWVIAAALLISFPMNLALAMILTKGVQGEQDSIKYGKGVGGSICHLEIFYKSLTLHLNGVLVNLESQEKTPLGTILTVAHAFKSGETPRAIYISFSSNPLLTRDRLKGISFAVHPAYILNLKKNRAESKGRGNGVQDPSILTPGPDLAVIRFNLPEEYSIPAMDIGFKMEELDQKTYLGSLSKAFFIGGYGNTALNKKDQEWLQEDKINSRRVAHTFAAFVPKEKDNLTRDSFESKVKIVQSSENSKSFLDKQLFTFHVPPEPFLRSVVMGVSTFGDSGSPLFAYDGTKNNFRVYGIHDSNYLIFDGESPLFQEVISSWTALTPEMVQWIHSLTDKNFTDTLEFLKSRNSE